MNERSRGLADLFDCVVESSFICFRGLIETAELAYKLERRGADFVLRSRWLEVEKRLDISAHGLPPELELKPVEMTVPPGSVKADLGAFLSLLATPRSMPS
jgi:hypothetical protein